MYRVSNIEVLFLKMLKNIKNKCFFVNTWVYFQENIIHFDIHALTFQKIKTKWKIFSFEKKNFFISKIFFEIFWKKFFALNCFLGWFMAKKFFLKKFQKKFWPKKIRNFFQNLICEKVPSFSQKMMIYHKMPMSGVYENIF